MDDTDELQECAQVRGDSGSVLDAQPLSYPANNIAIIISTYASMKSKQTTILHKVLTNQSPSQATEHATLDSGSILDIATDEASDSSMTK
jgi:hypothetical protein